MRPARLLAVASALLLPGPMLSAYHAGVTFFELVDPVYDRAAAAVAIYPATVAGGATRSGEYRLDAALDAPAASGTFPLVVISHGHGGSRFAHHDLAVSLARSGFIVAAVDHLGDSVRDATDPVPPAVLLARPRQVSALLDAVLQHEFLASHVDSSRIGVAGFSAGGFTALALAGAVPNFELWEPYCRRRPGSAALCPAPADVKGVAMPPSFRDGRVDAVYVMAPLALLFDRQGLQAVKIPVRVVAGRRDRILPEADNVRHLTRAPSPPAQAVADRGGGTFHVSRSLQ